MVEFFIVHDDIHEFVLECPLKNALHCDLNVSKKLDQYLDDAVSQTYLGRELDGLHRGLFKNEMNNVRARKTCSSTIDYTCIKFTHKYDEYFYIASRDFMSIDETSSSSSTSSESIPSSSLSASSTSHPAEQ
jgi:hypothetical protein